LTYTEKYTTKNISKAQWYPNGTNNYTSKIGEQIALGVLSLRIIEGCEHCKNKLLNSVMKNTEKVPFVYQTKDTTDEWVKLNESTGPSSK
jgi:hypothetical protein